MIETNEIQAIITEVLPGFWSAVHKYKSLGAEFIAIKIAAKDCLINRVEGQRPQAVSLSLNPVTFELKTQVYGGNGGDRIYREPNLNNPNERFLAQKNIKIPFRRPQANKESVLKAIKKFCEAYKKALIDNIETLTYQRDVNYKELLQL